jgi:3-oxoacyl-[acyl-carrier-protein] synthase II
MTGHTEGAAGAFGALAAVLSLQHDALPPLAGFTARDAALPPLRLALDGTEHHAGRNVLVNTSGFGGANASSSWRSRLRLLASVRHQTAGPSLPRRSH